MRHPILGLFIAGAVAGMFLAARAATPAPSEGQTFVRANCATCHDVDAAGRSSPNDAAPPFSDLAANPAVTALALRVMLQTSHQSMPNFRLTPDQTAAVIAYILAMRRP